MTKMLKSSLFHNFHREGLNYYLLAPLNANLLAPHLGGNDIYYYQRDQGHAYITGTLGSNFKAR